MPRVCTVCAHPERAIIDAALVAGTPNRRIATQHGLSEAAVRRHAAEHLPASLVTAAGEEATRQALDVLAQLKQINASSVAILAEARRAKDGDLALKAVDRIHKQIELQAKLLGDLDERPVVNVLVTPEWQQLRGQLVAALQPFPEARVAVAAVLAC